MSPESRLGLDLLRARTAGIDQLRAAEGWRVPIPSGAEFLSNRPVWVIAPRAKVQLVADKLTENHSPRATENTDRKTIIPYLMQILLFSRSLSTVFREL